MLLKAYVHTPEEAWSARHLGVDGICRTETSLLAPYRLEPLRSILVAEDKDRRERGFEALLPLHRSDLKTMFRAMSQRSIMIRLLDPPLDRLLPTAEQIAAEYAEAQSNENYDELFMLARLRGRVSHVRAHTSVRHRGCRLGLTHPEILRLQVRAALDAALELQAEGVAPEISLLLPLVSSGEEISVIAGLIGEIAADLFFERGQIIHYRIGALIETPGAAICAAEISRHVDVVAFGTNDLTRMTYGFSSDDIKNYLGFYLERGILGQDPFAVLDQRVVGKLMADAVREIRQNQPKVEIGVCGDHSADPESLRFFESLGLNFAACALPVLEEAQGSLKHVTNAAG